VPSSSIVWAGLRTIAWLVIVGAATINRKVNCCFALAAEDRCWSLVALSSVKHRLTYVDAAVFSALVTARWLILLSP